MSSESGINSTRIVDDPTDPCYLHHGDSPSSVLVSQPLIGENYNAWRRSMMIALVVKNKLGFIDGSVSKPPSTDAKYALWIRCDMMVLSWIINSLSKDIANSVMYIDSAKELWDELKERFSESNGPRIFQLQRAISSLAQGQMSVSLYFTKLKGYWDELMNFKPQPVCKCNPPCSCGVIKGLMDYQQQEQIMQFLNGLNEVFAQTREQILLLEPLPTLNKVYAMVLAQERLKRISLAAVDVDAEATALLGKTYSGKQGYQRRDKPICSHCGMTGLVIDKCYKLHGYPCGYKSNRPRRKSGMANQVSGMDSEMPSVTDDSSTMTQLPFTKEQCEQLIQLLKIHGGQQTTHQANEISAVPHSSDSLMSASGELSLKTDMDAAKQVPHLQPELSKDEVKSKLESSLIGGLAVEISTAETSGSQPNFSNIGNPPPNMKLNAEPEKPSTIRVLFPTAPPTSGSGAGEKNEGLDVAVPEEDKVEEPSERVLNQMAVLSVESPVKRQNVKKELFETIGIPYNASLSFPDEPEVSYNPTPPNSNPFGAPFSNATPTQVTSAFNTTIPSGELFRPASFNFLSPQSAQPSPPTNSGAFSGGFGAATTPQAPSQIGFGQRAQIGSGQQALGSVLGAFGQSRQLGTGLSGSGFVFPSGAGGGNNSTGGFSSPAPSGGFAGVASTVGGFAGLASGGGGFAGVASAGGGYSGPASSGGFAGAASSGGFPVAGGYGAFSSQQGSGGFSAFSNNTGGTGKPPDLFTQMRR